jgi:type II secretory pathway pseudopilin PulG
LIELMVVVAIIIMALGIMAPTLLEFFKNQRLKNCRAHFSNAFNAARLLAITEGTATRVVFFKEGVRVYNIRERSFKRDEEFNPDAAPGSTPGISVKLRFASTTNASLTDYRTWEDTQPNLRKLRGSTPDAGTCKVDDLVAIEFERDGSVRWLKGDDISTAKFNADPPDADIIVTQEGNPEALFIDVRNTGPIRTDIKKAGANLLEKEPNA